MNLFLRSCLGILYIWIFSSNMFLNSGLRLMHWAPTMKISLASTCFWRCQVGSGNCLLVSNYSVCLALLLLLTLLFTHYLYISWVLGARLGRLFYWVSCLRLGMGKMCSLKLQFICAIQPLWFCVFWFVLMYHIVSSMIFVPPHLLPGVFLPDLWTNFL